MHCLTVIYPRPDDPEHFKKYYKETHVPLAKQLPGLKSCAYAYPAAIGPADNVPFCIFQAWFEISRSDGSGDAIGHGQEGRGRRAELFAQGCNHLPFRAGKMTVQETYDLTIGGKSVPTQDHFEVRNPSTGEVVESPPRRRPNNSTRPSTPRRPRSQAGRKPRRTSARSFATRWRRSSPTTPKRSRA